MSAAPVDLVVIGASAGAVQALSVILPSLSAKFRLAVLVVVHVPPGVRNTLIELFAARCRLDVVEAEDKAPIQPGVIHFAPPNYHLLVETGETLSLSSDEPVLYSRPSIDVLFESAADAYGSRVAGVILTGANQDGARGLAAIADKGGMTVVQDPAEAQSASMPEAAIEACPEAEILSLAEIGAFLQRIGAEHAA